MSKKTNAYGMEKDYKNDDSSVIHLDNCLNVIDSECTTFYTDYRYGGGSLGFQETFKALSDPTRREILEMLKLHKMSAGDIASHFNVSNATISHHLAILKNAGLIDDEKAGKYIYYDINLSVVEEILGWLATLSDMR